MGSIIYSRSKKSVSRPQFSQKLRQKVEAAVAYVALTVLALLTLVPIIWMVLSSFKAKREITQIPPVWFPSVWQPENYLQALDYAPFGQYLWNTLVISLSVTIIVTSTSALAAYAFARLKFRGRDMLFLLYLGTLMIPGQVTVIPLFTLMRDIGWIDTYQGLIIPQAFSAFGTFMLRQFFLTIPFELEEAARIDGASRFRCFIQIIVPLSGAALATLAVFSFLAQWNNLFWPLIMSSSDSKFPIAVGLRNFQGQFGNEWHLLMAAASMATVPVIIVYMFTQRWFVKGIALSGFGGR